MIERPSSPAPPVGLDVIALSDDVTVGVHRRAVLVHYRGKTLAECVVPMRDAMKAVAGRGNVVWFAVVETSSVPPDETARRALTRFFEEYAHRIAVMTVTHRGEGFRGALVRLIVQGVMSLAPSFRFSFPKHVVGTLDEAAALARKTDPSLERGELIAAFDALAAMKPA